MRETGGVKPSMRPSRGPLCNSIALVLNEWAHISFSVNLWGMSYIINLLPENLLGTIKVTYFLGLLDYHCLENWLT